MNLFMSYIYIHHPTSHQYCPRPLQSIKPLNYNLLPSTQLSSAHHPTNLHTDFDPNMPPSFIYRKAFQACWRLDRILLPRPPPQAYLAFLRSRPSSINRMKVWWWNKTPMGRNLFVIAPWSVATHVWFYRLLWKS
ncbi:hypothetical protein QC760_11307 [Botrytis cinerea]